MEFDTFCYVKAANLVCEPQNDLSQTRPHIDQKYLMKLIIPNISCAPKDIENEIIDTPSIEYIYQEQSMV
ncbi:hypothetical protein ACTXT7_001251 [Hymenolepis weldensis]